MVDAKEVKGVRFMLLQDSMTMEDLSPYIDNGIIDY
jgi:hypothetical protein